MKIFARVLSRAYQLARHEFSPIPETETATATNELMPREAAFAVAQGVEKFIFHNPETGEIQTFGAASCWELMLPSEYTATPLSANEITTLTDFTAVLHKGDVLKITDSQATKYIQISSVAANKITTRGVPIVGDISSLKYESNNANRLDYRVFSIADEEFYAFGTSRPQVRETPGGSLVTPSNLFGTDIFLQQKPEFPANSHLVFARAVANSLGEATAAQLSVTVNAATVTTIDLDATENIGTIDYTAQSLGETPEVKINITDAGGANVSGVVLDLVFFTDLKID